MNEHILVLSAYNRVLQNPLIDLWIRRRIQGRDLRVSQVIDRVPEPSGDHLEHQLWTYIVDNDLKGLSGVFPEYRSDEWDWGKIKQNKDENVKSILNTLPEDHD